MTGVSKDHIRRTVKDWLRGLSRLDREGLSHAISRHLSGLLMRWENGAIGVFAPLTDEVDWSVELGDLEGRWVFPAETAHGMAFFPARFSELTKTRSFGVQLRTPRQSVPVTPAVLVVPGIAFTKDGRRLGRGKGHYDRFLRDYHGVTIGVCYGGQLQDSIPSEAHDACVDYVVTELGIIDCRQHRHT